jgi:hypothetical protein
VPLREDHRSPGEEPEPRREGRRARNEGRGRPPNPRDPLSPLHHHGNSPGDSHRGSSLRSSPLIDEDKEEDEDEEENRPRKSTAKRRVNMGLGGGGGGAAHGGGRGGGGGPSRKKAKATGVLDAELSLAFLKATVVVGGGESNANYHFVRDPKAERDGVRWEAAVWPQLH